LGKTLWVSTSNPEKTNPNQRQKKKSKKASSGSGQTAPPNTKKHTKKKPQKKEKKDWGTLTFRTPRKKTTRNHPNIKLKGPKSKGGKPSFLARCA